jgi:hypothetical protein
MRKLFLAFALTLSLAGCGTFSALTAQPSVGTAITLGNTFDGVKAIATAYVNSCTPRPLPAQCSRAAINQLIPAIDSGTEARNQIKKLATTSPDQIGASTAYANLNAAVTVLQTVIAEYHIGA